MTAPQEEQIAFYSKMLDLLPDKTHGGHNKDSKPHFIEAGEALHDYKFIRFNTKKYVTMLIFDIDNVSGTETHWHKRITDSIGLEINWTLRTTNGIQFGIFLDEICWTQDYDGNPTTDRERLKALKKAIGESVGKNIIDENGSNRLLGIWRNPIVHSTVISDKTYSLDYLLRHFKIKTQTITRPAPRKTATAPLMDCKMRLTKDGWVNQTIDKGFIPGNRHNYFSALVYYKLFTDRASRDSLLKFGRDFNQSQSNPISDYQVEKRVGYVLEKESTMYQPSKPKKRGKLSDYLWKHNIHGTTKRRATAGLITSHNKRVSAHKEILENYVELFSRGITSPSVKQVTGVSRFKKTRVYEIVGSGAINPAAVLMQWLRDSSLFIIEQSGKAIEQGLQIIFETALMEIKNRIEPQAVKNKHERKQNEDSNKRLDS